MQVNTQRPLPVVADKQDGLTLQVQGEPFYTVQGEGPLAGRPAVFIRLYGCTLRCPGCDTDYTSDLRTVKTSDLVDAVLTLSAPMLVVGRKSKPAVVITGGEPFRQNVAPLVRSLTTEFGFQVQIETNGMDPPRLDEVWNPLLQIVVSPKLAVHKDVWAVAMTAKYVLNHSDIDPEDGLPTGVLGYNAPPDRPPVGWPGRVYVQPEDDQDEETNKRNAAATVKSAMTFGHTISVQTHKILGLP